ncbi:MULTISPECIES: aldose 1-epimerase family protein [unclassified Saccharopolyspora]|uniref:aldose 1-epimerase family protein n=1 Tax=unclassified Saccharopolyspora TaxID=2646250 RepID=UPI001CD4894D|nr:MULTISPECIES: aldose 1-epimerase family protein [unclassified Saccharopolyspora]MCA1185670.1 aldose 1-epimerase family protein [Saccharopolyspora sp. 6T]MCA1226854.1 aldose 1-epimerase family protein [Saccharopolyspora sp. 6M]MCA1280725.1 aldose 1-epimerase family protein [Saccharopolyspora sp. 7B]
MSQEHGSPTRWSRRSLGGAALAAAGAAGLTAAAGALPGAGRAAADPPAGAGRSMHGRLYELRSGRHTAVVAGVAATMLSWQVDGTEMLLTHGADELGEGWQGKTLLPWANRIDGGSYEFGGERLQVPINEPERDCALHGLMGFTEWSPVEHRRDRVVLEHVLPPHYGYPFQLAFRIEFALERGGFRSTLSARNIGSGDAPFATANHTYLAAGTGPLDDLVLELPADTYYEVDDRLLPTGTSPVAGGEFDFRAARPIGSTVMDTAFTDLARDAEGTATVRFGRSDGSEVALWVDRTHGYLQVYTDDSPETDRPARSGITVEPMTCAPNAFVTGDGLIVLRPGQEHRGSWGYRIEE